jgi:ribonuclease Z
LKSNEFSITFLGVSAASINPFSTTSTCLVEAGNTKIMVDVGIGALRQLHKMHVNPGEIDAVLITHWHFDHYAGLPSLLKSRKRNSLLSVYGPKLSIAARIYLVGLLHSKHACFELVQGNFCKDCGDIHLETVPTVHGIVSFGWVLAERFPREKQGRRRIVVSGDTRPAQTIIDAAKKADLLVHEATYSEKHANEAYNHEHSTVAEAATLASGACVGALALVHIAHQNSKLGALKEAEKIFPQVLAPSPLDRIDIDALPADTNKENGGWGQVRMVKYPILKKCEIVNHHPGLWCHRK